MPFPLLGFLMGLGAVAGAAANTKSLLTQPPEPGMVPQPPHENMISALERLSERYRRAGTRPPAEML